MKDLGDMNWRDVINREWHRLSCEIDHVMGQFMDAVVSMLKSGVVHRDSKPENIMVRYHDQTGHFHLTFVDFTDALTKEDWKRSKSYIDFGIANFMSPQSLERRQGKIGGNHCGKNMSPMIYGLLVLSCTCCCLEQLSIHKRKNYQDVVALLSLDSAVRLDWLRKKIRQQQQTT